MQKIIPHLWFDREAKEAAEFYVKTFGKDSKITYTSTLRGTPSGDTDIVSFDLLGHSFMAISAGPLFRFNPSISFHVKCDTKEEVDRLWKILSKDGKILMELGAYPFSERYGWLEDRYGLSWQLIFAGKNPITQIITPVLMFTQHVAGRAEEAIRLYTSLFPDSKILFTARYGKGQEPEQEGTLQYASFALAGQEFGAMDSKRDHRFVFNEAVSLLIQCDSQEEIDRYWAALSAVPEAEQCGWLKDRFGVSWQVSPTALHEMLRSGDQKKIDRVTQAFLKMKKVDLAALASAARG